MAGVAGDEDSFFADLEIERIEAALAVRLLGEPPVPVRVGRYVLRDRLGSGGMGVVYEAYDEQLERRVAIKVLHRHLDGEGVKRRLRREAQAMARVSHENIAQVYEVGESRGQAFVAMEFVEGRTLQHWLRGEAPSKRRILEVYLQAGRGLAAAHAAGIVHRDFKPENVLLGADGRVRVVDFGLVRAVDDALAIGRDERTLDDEIAVTLTRTGSVVGTPAYMAPEQFRGEVVGAAADQFAFAVALFEALYGARPFAGDTWNTLRENVTEGRLREPPSRVDVTPHLANVLARALSIDPLARWPDMTVLLAAIQRDPTRWRRRARWLGAGIVTSLGIAGLAVAYGSVARERATMTCTKAGDVPWNDDAASRVRTGLLATKTVYADATAERVLPILGGYADAWAQARIEACLAARVERRWTDADLDRATACLAERRAGLELTIDQLASASADTMPNAIRAASALAPIDPCRDADALARLPVEPAHARDAIRAVRAAILAAEVQRRAGRLADAIDHARANVVAAEAIEWTPLSAAARLDLGLALDSDSRYRDAETELSSAYFLAQEAGAHDTAAEASTTLVRTVGVRLGRRQDGLEWSRHAESALAQVDDPRGLLEARWLEAIAELRLELQEREPARELATRALALREHAFGVEHPSLRDTLLLLARINAIQQIDKFAAEGFTARAFTITEAAFGPDHPDLIDVYERAVQSDIDLAVSQRQVEQGLALAERSLGPDHVRVAKLLVALAQFRCWREGPPTAKVLLERALAIQERRLAPDHGDLAATLVLLGMTEHPTREAMVLYERAIVIAENAYGPTYPSIAPALYNIAEIHAVEGDYAAAIEAMERALAVRALQYSVEDGRYQGYAVRLAQYRLARGEFVESRRTMETTIARNEELQRLGMVAHELAIRILLGEIALRVDDPITAHAWVTQSLELAWTHEDPPAAWAKYAIFGEWVLARALWDLPEARGRDRARAIHLARQVAAWWRDAPREPKFPQWVDPCPLWCTDRDTELARIEAWLREAEAGR